MAVLDFGIFAAAAKRLLAPFIAKTAQPSTAPTSGPLDLSGSDRRIIQILQDRKDAGYEPQSFSDHHRVALVIEGGGLGGAVLGALVTAIHDLNLTNSLDAIYAGSAGVPVAGYLLGGNAEVGTTLFPEDLVDGRFLNIARLLPVKGLMKFAGRETCGGLAPIMDLDFIFGIFDGTGIRKDKIIDAQKVINHKVPLKIIVSDLDDRKAKVISGLKSTADFWKYMRASCLVPGAAGQPIIDDNGHRLVDAKVTRINAVQQALDDDYTDVVVLTPRPISSPLNPPGMINQLMDGITINLIRQVAKTRQEGNELVAFAKEQAAKNEAEVAKAMQDSRVMFLGLPPDHPLISSSERDGELLRQSSITTYDFTMKRLSLGAISDPVIPARWRAQPAPAKVCDVA